MQCARLAIQSSIQVSHTAGNVSWPAGSVAPCSATGCTAGGPLVAADRLSPDTFPCWRTVGDPSTTSLRQTTGGGRQSTPGWRGRAAAVAAAWHVCQRRLSCRFLPGAGFPMPQYCADRGLAAPTVSLRSLHASKQIAGMTSTPALGFCTKHDGHKTT